VLRLLQRRFGLLPLPLEEQLRALSSEQLEQLAEALLEFNAISDLETWLRQRSV
jgi:hypothetical protein